MFITLWDVKEPTHQSQRVGHRVPGVLVWSLCYFMIHGLGGMGEVANGLIAAVSGAYTYADVRSHPCTEVMEAAFEYVYRKYGT